MRKKDKNFGTTVKELAPPVLVTCRAPDCGHQFWARKPVEERPGHAAPAPSCPKCHAASTVVTS